MYILKGLVFTFLITFSVVVSADVYVEGYHRKDGTYVKPHYRSDPNDTAKDNWSTKGNVNPYTGEVGTKTPKPDDNSDVYVEGYYRDDGTYVKPHYRSNPNDTTIDNWSTKGNINPYTGKPGTKPPDPEDVSSGKDGDKFYDVIDAIKNDRQYKDAQKEQPSQYIPSDTSVFRELDDPIQ